MRARFLLPLLAVLPVAGCDSSDDGPDAVSVTATVVAAADLSTLEAAVIQANLDEALASETATFTVLAPTDAAFQALLTALGATPAQLLARPDLGTILQTHVVSGAALDAADLTNGQVLTTLSGERLTVSIAGGTVGFDTDDAGTAPNATVTTADIQASNGVVHKINAVLLP